MKHHGKIAAAFSVNAKFLPFFAHLYTSTQIPSLETLTLRSSYPPWFHQKLICLVIPIFLFSFKISLSV